LVGHVKRISLRLDAVTGVEALGSGVPLVG
jgi:hypothetical protein